MDRHAHTDVWEQHGLQSMVHCHANASNEKRGDYNDQITLHLY